MNEAYENWLCTEKPALCEVPKVEIVDAHLMPEKVCEEVHKIIEELKNSPKAVQKL